MDYNLFLKQMEETFLPHLPDEQVKASFVKQLKRIKRELRGSEFKLKRTIQDKQITTNVLENTICELKIQSENLKHQKVLTEEQAAFKEQLFANVSHELRTPLHGILGMSHLLENTELQPTQKGYVDIIRSSADNLLVIINDLLNLSKINAGKTILLKEPFSTAKFLKDLHGVLSFSAQEKGLDFKIITPSDLPEFIVGDRTRLYQILLNLLNNAIKYTDHGYISLRLEVLEKSAKQIQLLFEVDDSGIGIEPDKLNSIFDSFTQLEVNQGKVYEGVGLGLNIVKKLLNLMGGSVEVVSSHLGTSFRVKLSFGIPKELPTQATSDKEIALQFPQAWQKKKILLIEDNEANLVYAKNLFASSNIPLEVAEYLSVAAKKVAQQKYDCILSDIKLPDGNGMDFLTQLRGDATALNQNTPIIILTASANENEAKHAKTLNIHSYISKPFPPQILIREMKKIFPDSRSSASFELLPPQAKPASNQLSEESYFKHLEKNFGKRPKLQVEMMDIFLEQLAPAIEQMEKGLAQNDIKIFHYDAHRIKSTINIIGLPKLKPIITKMDEYCYKKINLDLLPALLAQFKAQVAEDVKIIQARKEALLVVH